MVWYGIVWYSIAKRIAHLTPYFCTASNRCVMNCGPLVISSSRVSLRTQLTDNCHPNDCGHSLTYRWNMFRKEGNSSHFRWFHLTDLATYSSTKVESKNLVLKPLTLTPGFEYRLTFDVLSLNHARGWAEYVFETSVAPSGGTCNATQIQKGALATVLNITCEGWIDKDEPLMYEFYRKLKDGTFNMLSYGASPHGVVRLPPAADQVVVDLKVVVLDALGTASEVFLQMQVR